MRKAPFAALAIAMAPALVLGATAAKAPTPFLGSPMPLQNPVSADVRAATTSQVTQPMRSSGLTSENTGGGVASNSTSGSGTGTSTGTGFVNPAIVNGTLAPIAEGNQVIFDANGNPVATSATLGMASPASTFVVNNGLTATDYAVADRTMNQVIRDSRAERHRVGRNGQLLYSIAPRTNVDRSREMPDDGPLAFAGPIR